MNRSGSSTYAMPMHWLLVDPKPKNWMLRGRRRTGAQVVVAHGQPPRRAVQRGLLGDAERGAAPALDEFQLPQVLLGRLTGLALLGPFHVLGGGRQQRAPPGLPVRRRVPHRGGELHHAGRDHPHRLGPPAPELPGRDRLVRGTDPALRPLVGELVGGLDEGVRRNTQRLGGVGAEVVERHRDGRGVVAVVRERLGGGAHLLPQLVVQHEDDRLGHRRSLGAGAGPQRVLLGGGVQQGVHEAGGWWCRRARSARC